MISVSPAVPPVMELFAIPLALVVSEVLDKVAEPPVKVKLTGTPDTTFPYASFRVVIRDTAVPTVGVGVLTCNAAWG